MLEVDFQHIATRSRNFLHPGDFPERGRHISLKHADWGRHDAKVRVSCFERRSEPVSRATNPPSWRSDQVSGHPSQRLPLLLFLGSDTLAWPRSRPELPPPSPCPKTTISAGPGATGPACNVSCLQRLCRTSCALFLGLWVSLRSAVAITTPSDQPERAWLEHTGKYPMAGKRGNRVGWVASVPVGEENCDIREGAEFLHMLLCWCASTRCHVRFGTDTHGIVEPKIRFCASWSCSRCAVLALSFDAVDFSFSFSIFFSLLLQPAEESWLPQVF